VNLPGSATPEDIGAIYRLGHRIGLKAIAVYRDGSKAAQPLSAARPAGPPRAVRTRLPEERSAIVHRFTVGGQKGYLTVSTYPDGSPGELFLKLAKQGSTLSGFADALAMSWSVALQHGVPVAELAARFLDHRFEPAGFTGSRQIPHARSVVDYLARFMILRYAPAEAEARGLSAGPPGTTTAPEAGNGHHPGPGLARLLEASGDICAACGSGDVVRAGTCLTCRGCGSTTGCG